MGLTRPRAHQLQDIDFKQTARAITSSNITLSGGAPATVDGVSLLADDRVLVNGQSDASENGIYFVATLGSGSNGTFTRTGDANATGEINSGMIIMVTEGTSFADTQWMLTTDGTITVGSTAIYFAQVSSNSFGIVAVSGQDNIVADTVGDTLTMVGGTNLALTTVAGTDTLTLTPSLTPALTTATFTNTTTDDSILVTTTEASSSAAPVITLKRNSASVADADYLGQLKFKGENDADQEVVYAKITAKIQDASDGSEDGLIEFANRKAGSNTITARLRSDSLQLLNGTSLVVAGLTYPTSDGSNGQVIVTDGSGTLSFAAASGGGATVTSDTSTNAERLIYVGSTTSGTLSAVTQDSGLTYNPSSGSLTSAAFIGNLTGGAVTATSLSVNSAYSLPTADGNANQLLKTDGSGTLSFSDLTAADASITVNNFTGNNSTTAFTITTAPSNANSLLVTINGITQRPTTDYTVSGTTLTFGTAPFTGANISSRLIGGSVGGTFDPGSVGESIIPDTDVTYDLGTASKRFRDIFLSGSTINLGGAIISVDGTSGAVAVVPKSTSGTPNPVGVVFTKTGEMKTVTSDGGAVTSAEIATAAASNDVTPATTVVTNPTDLPSSPVAGTMGYVTSNNKLYLHNGTAWYVFAGVNEAPTISGLNAAYSLATDGTATVITMSSSDPEGLPVTFSSSATGLGSIATISQTDNVFTITPSTDSSNAGSFTLVITGTDGVNSVTTATATLTLPGGVTATGGDSIVTSGGFKIHTFTSSGTFAVTGTGTVEYLVIAGGGGGGKGAYGNGGGGGAGGYRSSVSGESSGGGASAETALSVSTGNYTVTIGAGGAGATSGAGSNGSDSVFGSITSVGGGGGGTSTGSGGIQGAATAGGSGGGGGGSNATGGAGTANQGFAGGTAGPYSPPNYPGGGGGGASATPSTPANSSAAGASGGAGVASSITGSSVTRAGGGGGGVETGTAGSGGAGGGGAGNSGATSGTAGTANTGGGGGAGYTAAGAGGSGIVIVRYAV